MCTFMVEQVSVAVKRNTAERLRVLKETMRLEDLRINSFDKVINILLDNYYEMRK